jgi:hypothetical protein
MPRVVSGPVKRTRQPKIKQRQQCFSSYYFLVNSKNRASAISNWQGGRAKVEKTRSDILMHGAGENHVPLKLQKDL